MKLRRSERMVVISNYLINNPYQLTSFNTFSENMKHQNLLFQKISPLSKNFEESGIGEIETVKGASVGLYIFTPGISDEEAKSSHRRITDRLQKVIVSFQVVIFIYQTC